MALFASKNVKIIYTYWMACWREGDETRNANHESARDLENEAGRRKARTYEGKVVACLRVVFR
jgi:hypothetical protein